MIEHTTIIRDLNDKFRKGDTEVLGEVVVTRGLIDLLEKSDTPLSELMGIVQRYENFTSANDPHGEHDLGVFVFLDYACLWKIDYYDPTLKWGSEDASDPTKTTRVLTILLASEY